MRARLGSGSGNVFGMVDAALTAALAPVLADVDATGSVSFRVEDPDPSPLFALGWVPGYLRAMT